MFKNSLTALLFGASAPHLTVAAPAASNEGAYLTNCDEFEPGRLYSEMDCMFSFLPLLPHFHCKKE